MVIFREDRNFSWVICQQSRERTSYRVCGAYGGWIHQVRRGCFNVPIHWFVKWQLKFMCIQRANSDIVYRYLFIFQICDRLWLFGKEISHNWFVANKGVSRKLQHTFLLFYRIRSMYHVSNQFYDRCFTYIFVCSSVQRTRYAGRNIQILAKCWNAQFWHRTTLVGHLYISKL